MNPLLKEIEDEMKRTRLDKTRLYGLLAKICLLYTSPSPRDRG